MVGCEDNGRYTIETRFLENTWKKDCSKIHLGIAMKTGWLRGRGGGRGGGVRFLNSSMNPGSVVFGLFIDHRCMARVLLFFRMSQTWHLLYGKWLQMPRFTRNPFRVSIIFLFLPSYLCSNISDSKNLKNSLDGCFTFITFSIN